MYYLGLGQVFSTKGCGKDLGWDQSVVNFPHQLTGTFHLLLQLFRCCTNKFDGFFSYRACGATRLDLPVS